MKDFFIVDGHFDLGGIIYKRRKRGLTRILENEYYSAMSKNHVKLVVAAIFIETDQVDMALKESLLQINAILTDVQESEHFVIIESKKDLLKLRNSKDIGLIMSLEGAEPILRQKELLNIFYKLGVRGLGLTWSRRNFVADGSYFRNPREGIKGGLTPFGIEVLEFAEGLNMFVDVSHLNDPGFEDVLLYHQKPFIASHSNARAINNLVRNLTLDQLKSIQSVGGVIGINAYKKVVSENEDLQTIKGLCDHIEYMVKNIGADHVGFGFDFCTPYYESDVLLDVMSGYEALPMVIEELRSRDLDEATINKIAGENWYQFFLKHFK
ncbi:MAG: membrane dipeptidase [Clostridia bacterium]|nr:membrane dipeptidase [Clostridia bacterium]